MLDSLLLAASGLLLGLVFGAMVQRTHFCTMGAISDARLFGSWRRARSCLLALGIALPLTQLLLGAGLIETAQSIYVDRPLLWLVSAFGGLMFGFGMVLAGGCVSRNLARLGSGSLKAAVTLGIMTFVGWITQTAAAPFVRRTEAFGPGVAPSLALPMALGLGIGLLLFCLRDKVFRSSRLELVAGVTLGLLVPLGWLVTSSLGDSASPDRVQGSLNLLLPLDEASSVLAGMGVAGPFGLMLVIGAPLGSFLRATLANQLRYETFVSRDDLARHVIGGALMGVGGTLAGGCSIAHGLTGLSALSWSSAVVVGCMIGGAVWALLYLETGRLLGRAGATSP